MNSKRTKFESLLEAVQGALVGMDSLGGIRFVNHRTELLFGYDRDDLIGRHIDTLVPESLWHVYLSHRDDYFADPRSRSMGLDLELKARRSDGAVFPVDVSLSRIDTGDVLLVITALSDVIKTKEAFENAQRMAAVVEHSDDAIIAKTLEGRITSWNPACERMFGFSSLEIIGRSIYLLIPEDRVAETQAMLTKLTAGGSVEHYETERVRKDGTRITVSTSESPIRDEDGMVVGISTIARDVTERRNAFKEARAMIESSQDSLVAISPEGTISDANEATVKFTGVPRKELIGTTFSDYFTDPERANQIYQRVFDQGAAVNYPLAIRHRDGTLTDVLYNASVHRDAGGSVLGVFAAARDVTQQRRTQRELAEQLAAGLRHLTELEIFQQLTVGRELQMIELHKEIEYLRGLVADDGT